MSTPQDHARLIAERVARRLAGDEPARPSPAHQAPSNSAEGGSERPRARVIDFISSGPPIRSASSIGAPPKSSEPRPEEAPKSSSEFFQFIPVTQSPWHGRLPALLGNNPQLATAAPYSAEHASQERFGVEEATVAELVEFFEQEKKCAMDPSGKPCDHCAMCSSRGF